MTQTEQIAEQHDDGQTFEVECIEVRRSESGYYDVPGAAEVESWDYVSSDMQHIVRWDDLLGWGPWKVVYRAVDWDDHERWYFVR